MSVNVKDGVVFASPKDLEQRTRVAGSCVKDLGIRFPALIDDFQNTVDRSYTGWPDRLYVIDRDGRIAYKSAPGPFGFKPAAVAETLSLLAGRKD